MRYRRILIHPFWFENSFIERNITHVGCVKGLPYGAKFAYSYQEAHYGVWIVFEHESFEPLKDGDLIPIMDSPTFEKIS